jgi:hypothetical protein
MANGDDYDFSGWSKADCIDALTEVGQIASSAYEPESSREDLAAALGAILTAISDNEDDDADDEDDDAQGD